MAVGEMASAREARSRVERLAEEAEALEQEAARIASLPERRKAAEAALHEAELAKQLDAAEAKKDYDQALTEYRGRQQLAMEAMQDFTLHAGLAVEARNRLLAALRVCEAQRVQVEPLPPTLSTIAASGGGGGEQWAIRKSIAEYNAIGALGF